MRYKTLGVLITASLLTLGACAEEAAAPTVAPVDSPLVDEGPTETLPAVILEESPAAEDGGLDEPSPPAEDAG